MKKITTILLCAMLLLISVSPVYAEQGDSKQTAVYENKDEVVYVNMSSQGQIDNMYVVNGFKVAKPGFIKDYGDYDTVKNLTNLEDIKLDEGEVQVVADEGEFYYQGTLKKVELPWDITIRYLLDDKDVNPNDIVGEPGNITIEIAVNQTQEETVFNQYYLLQISILTDPEKLRITKSEDGTVANVGEKEQVVFTLMPGQDDTFVIETEATEFELAPIEINALPANMAVELPETDDMTEDFITLSDAIASIDHGVGELQNGLAELGNGLGELNKGSNQLNEGFKKISSSSSELTDGSKEIKTALETIDQSLSGETETPDLSALGQLSKGLKEMKDGLEAGKEDLKTLKEGYETSLSALESSIDMIPEGTLEQSDLNRLFASNADPQVLEELLQTYEAAKRIQYVYQETKQAFQAVPAALAQMNTSMTEVTGAIDEIIQGIASMDDKSLMEDLNKLAEGIHALATNYNSFHQGLIDYTNGIDTVASSYGEINQGIKELHNGANQLDKGALTLKDGTSELASETNDMPNEMEEEIEKMLEEFDFSDYEPVSFVSDKNEKLRTVQFVMKTEELKLEEEEEKEEVKKESKGFWEKFLDLFR